MTITIKSIRKQYVLNTPEFKYILEHLNQPLELADLWFRRGGSIDFLTIRTDDGRVITLFSTNGITFDIIGTEELACTHTI